LGERRAILWALSGLGLGFFLLAATMGWLFGSPQEAEGQVGVWCLFKRLTQFPCPTCGMTRGFLLISQGHWIEATRYNIWAVPLFLSMIGLAVSAWLAPVFAWRWLKQLATPWGLVLLISCLLVGWAIKLFGDPQYW
jgi:hypothetical protein